VYLWRARPAWIRRVLTGVLTCLTCGLAAPLFFVRNLKETLAQVHFGGRHVQFTSHTDEYVDQVWAPTVLWNILTCGCYRLCGCAEVVERGFVDNHLVATGTNSSPASWPTNSPHTGLHYEPPFVPTYSPSSSEQAPLLGDRPPPYQYGAPTPSGPGINLTKPEF